MAPSHTNKLHGGISGKRLQSTRHGSKGNHTASCSQLFLPATPSLFLQLPFLPYAHSPVSALTLCSHQGGRGRCDLGVAQPSRQRRHAGVGAHHKVSCLRVQHRGRAAQEHVLATCSTAGDSSRQLMPAGGWCLCRDMSCGPRCWHSFTSHTPTCIRLLALCTTSTPPPLLTPHTEKHTPQEGLSGAGWLRTSPAASGWPCSPGPAGREQHTHAKG